MWIVGLTGSIGMGKSTVAAHLRARGIPVFDADAEVHRLYRYAAVAPIEAAFPGTTTAIGVDREALSRALRDAPEKFKTLEKIVHPIVRASQHEFVERLFREGHSIIVLEVPLLFETGRDRDVDAVMVVSASEANQRARVLARPGMTLEKLESLLARQTPDAEKRRRAHFVVDTNGSQEASARQVDAMLDVVMARPPRAYEAVWQTRSDGGPVPSN